MSAIHKIKILETIRQGQIGGGESHLLSLVENLDKSKFEPVVLSFTEGPMVDRLKDMGIKTHVLYTEKAFDLSKWKQVKKLIADEKIELVHTHGTRANSNVLWAAKKLKLPVVYTIHGWSFHEDQNPIVKKIRILGEKLLTKKSDTNISVSLSNQQTGKKYFSGFESVVINNGIDQKKFDPKRNLKDIRAELNIPKENIVVVFIARFIHQKQPLKLISSFAKAAQKLSNLTLLMIGDGDQKPEALTLVDQLNIKDRIIFQPFRQDIPDLLAASDIYALPSLWEGLPIGLLEAMSMEKAIIGTMVDGTSEVLQDKKNGLLIPVENLENNLSNAIILLANNKTLRQQLGEKAKETISEKYSAENMTREVEEIYLQLLKNKK